MNARERLVAAAEWLGWNDQDLSAGLRNAFDGLRLYDYAQARRDLPELADMWRPDERIDAIGYDPMASHYHPADTSGANEAAMALGIARDLVKSIAFGKTEGDTKRLIAVIDEIIERSPCAQTDSASDEVAA